MKFKVGDKVLTWGTYGDRRHNWKGIIKEIGATEALVEIPNLREYTSNNYYYRELNGDITLDNSVQIKELLGVKEDG